VHFDDEHPMRKRRETDHVHDVVETLLVGQPRLVVPPADEERAEPQLARAELVRKCVGDRGTDGAPIVVGIVIALVLERLVRDVLGSLSGGERLAAAVAASAAPTDAACHPPLRDPVDERALYVQSLREGVSFLPGGAVQAERSSRTSMRLSFGLVEPEQHDEAVRRIAVALRGVRRRGRTSATGALS
jgi:hypothetical protein